MMIPSFFTKWLKTSSFASLLFATLISCQSKTDFRVFERIPSSHSGVTFSNRLTVTPEFNILNYMYFYNGGGVSLEDFNGDGLVDLFFTSNQDSNRLYVNKGNFQFEDVSKQANVFGMSDSWTTGSTTADVNGDGLVDIYVSMLGNYRGYFAQNLLYINQGTDNHGIPTFKEESAKYGLDIVGFSTQALFFDYDLDGDLDMYQLNHSVHSNGTYRPRKELLNTKHQLSGDKLMRNNHGYFEDVTDSAGLHSSALGYGLGVGLADLNDDGYPDIYVGNDFHEDDYLYINQQDGTFKDALGDYIRHTSRYSMGNDLGDI